jgi:hypothetical protein
VVKELVNGQTNVLLGTLMLLALMAAQQRRPIRAGAWTGAAVFVKPYALLFVPWLAATLAAVSVAAVMGVLAFGLLAPAIVYGWAGNLEQLHGWYQTVTSTTAPNLMIAENISFATMWAKWLGPGSTAAALALVTSVAALAVAAGVCLARRKTEQPHYLEVALLLLLIPVLSPQGWDYVLILGTPAIALLVDRWRDLPSAWQAVAGASLAIVSFTVFDLIGRRLYMLSMAWSVQSVAVMGIVATLAWLRWRRLA